MPTKKITTAGSPVVINGKHLKAKTASMSEAIAKLSDEKGALTPSKLRAAEKVVAKANAAKKYADKTPRPKPLTKNDKVAVKAILADDDKAPTDQELRAAMLESIPNEYLADAWCEWEGHPGTYDAYWRDLMQDLLCDCRGFVTFPLTGKTHDLRKATKRKETIFAAEPNGCTVFEIKDGKYTLLVHIVETTVYNDARKILVAKVEAKAKAKADAKVQAEMAKASAAVEKISAAAEKIKAGKASRIRISPTPARALVDPQQGTVARLVASQRLSTKPVKKIKK